MPTTTTGLATSYIQFSRASNATVTDADGKIKWAGHNLLTDSESFDASAWDKSTSGTTAPSVTANNAVAPNGTTTADKIDFGEIDAAGDYSVCSQFSTLSEANYTGTVYIKAVSSGDVGKKIWLYMYDTDFRGRVSITLTSNWQTFTTSANLTGGSGRQFAIATLGSNFGGENQGAVSVYVWGAHLYRSDLGGMVLNPARGDAYYPTTPPNLLGFTESLTTGWTNSNTTDSIVTETNPNGLASSVEVTATAGNGTLLGSLSLLASPYTFSIWLKRKTGTGTVEITVDGTTYVTAAVTSDWQRFSTTLTPSAGTKTPGIRLVTSGDAVYAWGAQLSDSASLDAYSPVYGAAVTSAAYYAPRLDYDPVTLAARGLLVEEQRSNLLTYSAQFDDLAWGKLRSSISANSTTAPDGTQTADKLVEDTSNNSHVLFPAVFPSLISATTYTFSLYAKQAERLQVSIVIGSGTTNWITAIVDLTNGSIVSSGSPSPGTTITVTPAANGFYRIVITGTSNSTTSYQYIQPCVNGSEIYQGNGTSGIYIWGAQLEAGSFATSYIPTLAASATRAADVASVATSAFPYNATEGTLVANVSFFSMTPACVAATITDGTANNYIFAFSQSGTLIGSIRSGGGTAATLTRTAVQANAVTKIGLAATANDAAMVLNGGSAATETTVTMPLNPSIMYLGLNTDGSSNPLNGHIRQITYLPRRLSNAELQARTA